MFRATALCSTLLALVLEGSCVDLWVGPGPSGYAQKLKVIQDVSDALDNVLVDRKYSVLEPELHYLVLLGVAYSTAEDVWGSLNAPINYVNAAFLDKLENEVPKVLLNPNATVDDVRQTKNFTLTVLKPFFDLVDRLCDDVGDNECDRLVNAVVKNDKDLKISTEYLDAAYDVASGLLGKEPRLQEVAKSLDVIPYLVANLNDVTDYVNNIVVLLNTLYPLRS